MKKVFYAIGVCVSAFFLVNAGASEQEATKRFFFTGLCHDIK